MVGQNDPSLVQVKRWEPIAGNRIVDLVNSKEITVEDIFGKANHMREEVLQFPPRTLNDDSRHLSEDLEFEDLSSSSPTLKAKLVKKVREVKNVADEYKSTRILKKHTQTGMNLTSSFLLLQPESPTADIR